MSFSMRRRSFLQVASLAPGLLPLLDAQIAKAAGRPKRLIVIAVPNGVREDVYWPKGTESKFVIDPSAPLSPLLPHQSDIVFVGGIKLQNGADALKTGLGGHGSLPFLLTGTRGAPGPKISDGVTISASGPSVDVFVAKALAKQKEFRFESLVLVPFRHADGNNDGYLSFNGAPIGGALPNVPSQRHDPVALFNDVFGGGAGTAALAKQRAQRKSVLDFANGYLKYMNTFVGAEDRRKLDAHAEGIRVIEKQLAAVDASCQKPTLGTEPLDSNVINANANVPAIIKAQIDITVAAMACDLTRVASFLWQDSGNVRWVWSWLGAQFTKKGTDFANSGENMGLRNDHEIAHRDGEAEYTPLKNRVCQWYMEQLAYLIKKLKDTPDVGGGSMFDNTVILFANMQRTGGGHQTDNLPWIIAGSGGGYFKTGRFLPWPSGTPGQNIPQNRVLASLCNAMDVPVGHFGEVDYGGELTSLRG